MKKKPHAALCVKAKPLTLSTLDAMQAGPLSHEDVQGMMARQLTEQWDKVVGGQREQLIFGAMMLKLREWLRDSARGAAQGNKARKGTGLKGWLAHYAPRVGESTAYRLMEIAEGVQEAFKLGRKVDLEALLSAQVENLDDSLAKKRAQIEECIAGQSQRQLLLQFSEPEKKRRGGHRVKGEGGDDEPQKPAGWTDAQWQRYLALDPEEREAVDLWTPLVRGLALEGLKEKSWAHLPDKGEVSRETLEGLVLDLQNLLRSAKAETAKPKKK